MKNFLSLDNLELKPSVSIKNFITASSEIIDYPIINILQDNKNIWLSEEFLPQEIILNFRNVELKEYPIKLAAIGVYCMNKYPTNPKIIEVLISQEKGNNFISLGHFDLSFKAGRQLIYLYDDNDVELEEILNNINFNNLIIKLIIKETFGGKQTYINNLYLYDNIDENNINNLNSNINSNINYNSNINDNNINEYMNFDDNMNINNDINTDINNDINDDINNGINNNINDINVIEDTKNKNHYFNNNKINNNLVINNEKSREIINGNEIGYFDKNISSKIEEDNISNYKSRSIIGKNNKNNIISKRKREVKTPKIFKKNINQEDRPKTANSLHNRSIHTTIKYYNKKNLLDYSNNNSLLTNSQFNNLHFNPSNKLNQLINEFRNYKENQELIMNNYEIRVKLLEERCKELKNTIKEMNITMNTLIESQYSQSQASNDYFLKECQNMINEAIINTITNMGRNMDPYSTPMYQNYPFNLKENKNMNKINMNYNNIHANRKNNNNNYIYEEFGKKEMKYNNINNYYDDIDYNYMMYDNDNNENDDNNYINNINDNQENYIEQEMQNNIEDNNENNDNLDNLDNFNNDNNENYMEYYQNDEDMNNNDNAIDNNNLNLNINNIINERNNDTQTIKSVHSNDLYNDGHIPYEERIKANSRKISNKFIQSTRNYNINTNNMINQNNNSYYSDLGKINNQIILNTDNESKINKNKNKSNNNYINSSLGESNCQNYQENNLNINIDINKEINNNYEKKKVPSKNESNRYKEQKKLVNKKRNINKTMDDGLNKELSSDYSIDNITINSKITEKLKPTLEKFENYISLNNFNNFGKSQNVYSVNSLNAKKEIFGENMSNNKLLIEKDIKKDNKKEDNKI